MDKRLITSLLLLVTLATGAPAAAAHRDDQGRDHSDNRGHHYDRYSRKGHEYNYKGHWRSWNEWEDYVRHHPTLPRRGNYYRESGHLMFRYCEPGSSACFFVSIGR